jgi:cytochrome c biogenesis protein CcdA
MADWLEQYDAMHPQQKLNRSKIFQDSIYEIMHPQTKKVSSQIVLMMFMNFVISMAIIFTSIMMPGNVVSQNLRLILIFLGLILTVMSLMTYRYEKSKINKMK